MSDDGDRATVTAKTGARGEGRIEDYLQDTGSDLDKVIRGQRPGSYSASLKKGQTILNIQVL